MFGYTFAGVPADLAKRCDYVLPLEAESNKCHWVMAQITLIEAVTQALAYEVKHDDSVVVLGEDVDVNGGMFRATQGLKEKFGELHALDTPLDEAAIAMDPATDKPAPLPDAICAACA